MRIFSFSVCFSVFFSLESQHIEIFLYLTGLFQQNLHFSKENTVQKLHFSRNHPEFVGFQAVWKQFHIFRANFPDFSHIFGTNFAFSPHFFRRKTTFSLLLGYIKDFPMLFSRFSKSNLSLFGLSPLKTSGSLAVCP